MQLWYFDSNKLNIITIKQKTNYDYKRENGFLTPNSSSLNSLEVFKCGVVNIVLLKGENSENLILNLNLCLLNYILVNSVQNI